MGIYISEPCRYYESNYSYNGRVVPCYDPERTICGIFRINIDPQDKQVAVKEYLKEHKNISKLMQYAETFKVDKKIKACMEGLL